MVGQYLLFRVGSRWCALPAGGVEETTRALPVEPVSDMPPFVRGVTLLRGAPTLVVDVATLLGGEPLTCPERFVSVRLPGGRVAALAVSEVSGLTRGEALGLQAPPPLLSPTSKSSVAALGEHAGALLSVLSLGHVIDDATYDRLAEGGRA